MKLRALGVCIATAATLGLAACGGVANPEKEDSAGQPSEVVSVAGRVTGGGMTIDVQLGHTFTQRPASSADTRVEGAASIK